MAAPQPPVPDPATSSALASKQPEPALAPISTPGRAAVVLLLSQLPVIGGGITAVVNSSLATWTKENPGTAALILFT